MDINALLPDLKPGRYRHFKGTIAIVHAVAEHTETKEPYVVYEHPDDAGNTRWWVRPYEMFVENVDKPEYNYTGPRFTYVGTDEPS